MKLSIYIDGGARGNPGPAAAGVVILDQDSDEPIHEGGYYIGSTTNNVAEYQGLLTALQIAVDLGAQAVRIHSDSQLMVRQILGQYRVKSPALAPLYQQAKALLGRVPQWQITHVLRNKNQRADQLVNLALDAGDDVISLPVSNSLRPQTGPHAAGVPNHERSITPHDAPRWSVRLTTKPGAKCPASRQTTGPYPFGPTTPVGLCVYATQAALANSPIAHSPPTAFPQQTRCPHCGVGIVIEQDRP